jgi:hypothetical protein
MSGVRPDESSTGVVLYFSRFCRYLRPSYTYVHASEVRLSPILVRPVREQLEHDRVIRLLQAKYKRKFDVAINPGNEQAASVLVGTSPWYPDLVLYTLDKSRKLVATVEVETGESINNLEAMSQWKTFSQLRAQFHLYVPAFNIDTVRRMVSDMGLNVAEIWAYSALGDQLRFTLVQRSAVAEKAARAAAAAESKPHPVAAKPVAAQPAAAKPLAAKPVGAKTAAAKPAPAPPARASGTNGRARTARPAAPPARRVAAPAAKPRRKAAATPVRSAKAPVARRAAAKKTAPRAQKRK